MNKAKRAFRPYSKRGVSSEKPFTECLCPRCGLVHRMKIKWIGRGIPKKFCERCKEAVNKVYHDLDGYSIKYSQLVD